MDRHHENRRSHVRFSWCFLLFGWGVPMPLPVRSRRYDDVFWKELMGGKEKKSKEQNLKELGF